MPDPDDEAVDEQSSPQPHDESGVGSDTESGDDSLPSGDSFNEDSGDRVATTSRSLRSATPKIDPAVFEAFSRSLRSATPKIDPAVFEAFSRSLRSATPKIDPAVFEAFSRSLGSVALEIDPAVFEAIRANSQGIDSAIAELWRDSVLSREETFETPPDDQRGFSPHLIRPSQVFEATEGEISGLGDLAKVVQLLKRKNPDLPLVWRGQQDADWGLHSSLYRLLLEERSVKLPLGKPVSPPQRFPSEADMVAVESALFEFMRPAWRMENVAGLELLARLQHHGGPTRFLDVTRNPLMALWFAVEPSDNTVDRDARLFAIATQPVLPDDAIRPSRYMESPVLIQGASPFWLKYATDGERRSADWGTGTKRRVWIPPAYDDRISAQNAAFLLEGLPIPSDELLDVISTSSEAEVGWRWADLAAAACFYVLPARVTRKVRPRGHRLAPVFTLRVPAAAKRRIWDELSDLWGLSPGVVYPDIQGLGQHLRKERGWVADALSRVDSQQMS